jgi:AcrR family transcriptional regulator
MGNREDLLAGAKQCLFEKGYLRTTARDISAASGVSLAGIGYHFGSKEALMNQALFEAIGEFGDKMESALAVDSDAPGGSLERFEAVWAQVIASVTADRKLWVASIEPVAQLDHIPEMREFFAMGARHSRTGLAALFLGIPEDQIDKTTARTLGSFYYALMTGMITQWLTDPENAPTGRDLADAVRAIAAANGLGPAAGQTAAADSAPAVAAAE